MADLLERLVPPFLWPDARVLNGSHAYPSPVPWESLLHNAKALAGVVSKVDLDGLHWLADVLRAGTMRCRLIFVVYPTGPTRADVLHALRALQSTRASGPTSDGPLVEFRVLPFELPDEAQATLPNVLYCAPSSETPDCLITGSSPNFGLRSTDWANINVAFEPDLTLRRSWWGWFDYVWKCAVPLTAESAEIPLLVPAPGSSSAAAAWQKYLTDCRDMRARDGTELAVSEALGVDVPDALAATIADIFRRGMLASVDKASRTPPLDVPVKAELFGISAWRRAGAGRRHIAYRFTVLDARELGSLEGIRQSAGDLLRYFTFPLSDAVRWMPRAARSLFEAELDRVNQSGHAALSRLIAGDPAAFVKQRRDRLVTAAQALYEENHPGQPVPDATVDEILGALVGRLQTACDGQLLPKMTYTPVQFAVTNASKWASQWGHAASLLTKIAEFPRKVLTDRRFLRGIEVDEDDLLAAMDVCGDAILKMSNRRDARQQARAELEILIRLGASPMDARARCDLLLRMIGGAQPTGIGAEIPEDPDG